MHKRDLDTPFVLIDMDAVDRNIAQMQSVATANGIALRPHAKTHKLPFMAHRQIEAGAIGVTVAKVGEAEVMADAGVKDILVAYPIVGESKVDRLVRLAKRVRLTVSLDSLEVASAISVAAERLRTQVGVLLEVDCGFHRVGLPPDERVLQLAREVLTLPGLVLRGIATFGGHAYDAKTDEERASIGRCEGETASQIARLLRDTGIPVDVVSVGSTPTAKWAGSISGVTEIRPGTYVFGDLMQVKMHASLRGLCPMCESHSGQSALTRPGRGRRWDEGLHIRRGRLSD